MLRQARLRGNSSRVRRKRKPARSPWGRELAMLRRGEPLLTVLASFLGNCSQGRATQAAWLQFLATLPSLRQRRRVLEHFLRTFEHAHQHGSQWRVTGRAAFVGRQHVWAERVDPESGEVRQKRVYCPSSSAGGLAAEQELSPRQQYRYRQQLRGAGVMGAAQPHCDASDAEVARRQPNGRWAYAHHWLRWPPTAEMRRRWGAQTAPARRTRIDEGSWTFAALCPPWGLPVKAPRRDDLVDLSDLADRLY